MSEQKYIKWLSIIVICLVSLVTVISFALSYEALWRFALDGGKPWYLAILWPVIIDLPIIVFSLVALFAVVLGYKPWSFRALVLLATAGTVWFNYSYARGNSLSWEVYITAPVMYFVSFEVLAWLIKITSDRAVIITKIAEIKAELGILEAEYQGRKDNLRVELEALAGQLNDTIAANEQELNRLREEIGIKARILETYNQDIEAKRQELKQLDGGQVRAYLPANLTIEQRQELANQMAKDGLTNEAIASALGVSVGTVKNDKRAAKVETNGHNGKG